LEHGSILNGNIRPRWVSSQWQSTEEVRVVILIADNQRTDIDGGVWPITHLDHLLEIAGAGALMAHIRDLFQQRVEANWMSALNDHRLDTAPILRT
jgi:hypothetical protein